MYRTENEGTQNEVAMNNLFLAANTKEVFEKLSPLEQEDLINLLASYTRLNINGLKTSQNMESEAVRMFK